MIHKLVFGTAAFAETYAGQAGVSPLDARHLAVEALRAGVVWFDTAPTYGEAEQTLGQTVAWTNGRIATKVSGNLSVQEARISLMKSRVALGNTRILNAVLMHNATVHQLCGPVMGELVAQKADGAIDLIGASVYDEDEALAAIDVGCDIVEVPFNLIDQRMVLKVFPAAVKANTMLWARSVWLRGSLTPHHTLATRQGDHWKFYPPVEVHAAADVARKRLHCADFSELADVALRFVLSFPAVSGVVIGPRTSAELQQAITASARGQLGMFKRLMAATLPVWPASVYDPRKW